MAIQVFNIKKIGVGALYSRYKVRQIPSGVFSSNMQFTRASNMSNSKGKGGEKITYKLSINKQYILCLCIVDIACQARTFTQ